MANLININHLKTVLNDIKNRLSGKQDVLTPSGNIIINDNKISAHDEHLTFTGNILSVTTDDYINITVNSSDLVSNDIKQAGDLVTIEDIDFAYVSTTNGVDTLKSIDTLVHSTRMFINHIEITDTDDTYTISSDNISNITFVLEGDMIMCDNGVYKVSSTGLVDGDISLEKLIEYTTAVEYATSDDVSELLTASDEATDNGES